MSNFMVRVELHGANSAHYDKLHVAMAAKGFVREIAADNGQRFALPTAEYVVSTTQDGEAVRGQADDAAATTGLSRAVVVVLYSWAWWIGLAKA